MARNPYKPEVVVKNGKPVSVILKIEDYEALLEAAEQADDLKAIRAMKKRDWETVSFEEYVRSKRRRASA
jgi:PHD/YefM family antitoxin component YafN of YafNO toxin-antitoxin module